MMETITEKTIKVARTRSGVPCLWESLVPFENLKRATIILDSNGKSKRAYYYNKEREKQALVGISTGDHMVKCFEDAHGVAISIFRIVEISSMNNSATIIPVYRKSSLVQDETYPQEYADMIKTCLSKLVGIGTPVIARKTYELENAI